MTARLHIMQSDSFFFCFYRFTGNYDWSVIRMTDKSSKDTSLEELNEQKELQEILRNLPQILKELEQEAVSKELPNTNH